MFNKKMFGDMRRAGMSVGLSKREDELDKITCGDNSHGFLLTLIFTRFLDNFYIAF